MTGPVYCGPACSSAGNTSALMSPMRKAKIGSEDSSGASITKLSNLNPYSSVWEIEVTVLKIDPIREFKNGTGKLQNLTVCDDSGTMRMTLWNLDVDKYGDQFQPQTVYRIANANIKPADKRYNKTGMDYELHSKGGMTVCESTKKAAAIKYNFLENLNEITKTEVGSMVDVCGIIQQVSDCREVELRAYNTRKFVRDFSIVDDSNTSVKVTLWGSDAEKFRGNQGDAIEIKGAKINEYNGKNLGTSGDSLMTIKTIHDCENGGECHAKTQNLLNWSKNTDISSVKFESLAQGVGGAGSGGAGFMNLKPLSTVDTMNLDNGQQFLDILATVVLYNKKENCYYMADPETNKKLNEQDGQWHRADGTHCENPTCRLLVNSIKIADQTGEVWTNAFNDQAEILLNCKGHELMEMQQTQGQEAVDDIFLKAQNQQFFMKMKVKEEIYQDVPRKRVTIVKVAEVDHRQLADLYIKDMMNEIQES